MTCLGKCLYAAIIPKCEYLLELFNSSLSSAASLQAGVHWVISFVFPKYIFISPTFPQPSARAYSKLLCLSPAQGCAESSQGILSTVGKNKECLKRKVLSRPSLCELTERNVVIQLIKQTFLVYPTSIQD